MTPERIAELTALCEKAKEMAPTYTEILLQPSIKDQTCTRVEECAYYDLSATRQLHNEIAASVGSALPELLAELTRLTRERDEAFNAGIEAAEKNPTAEQVAASGRAIDLIDAEADKWAVEINLVAMIKNIASATKLHQGVPAAARQDMADRAEQMIDALCRQTFLEAWIRCMDSAEEAAAIRALKKPATDEAEGKSGE